MEKKIYVSSPIVLEKLAQEYVDGNLLRNPRSEEINDTIFEIAESMGLLPKDRTCIEYKMRILPRLRMVLDEHTLSVDERGRVIISMPDRETEKETRIYELIENGRMRKTIQIVEVESKEIYMKVVSHINELGIEEEKEIYKAGKSPVRVERLQEQPHIIKTSIDGKEEYYDISQSRHPEDIEIEGAVRIKKEEIREITQVGKLRILAKVHYTAYENGIRSIYGINDKEQEEQKEQNR